MVQVGAGEKLREIWVGEVNVKCFLQGPLESQPVVDNGAWCQTFVDKQVMEEAEDVISGDSGNSQR